MIESFFLLIALGFFIGTIGTMIGAGGGFILVPVLILLYPDLSAESITSISLAIVAANAIVGSYSYMRSGRIDFKAGLTFALATIPGSIIGVFITKWIPRNKFDLVFGLVLISLSAFLFFGGNMKKEKDKKSLKVSKNKTYQKIIDKHHTVYEYAYNMRLGILLAFLIGFLSPILGIGGGVIHVPAMIGWLSFPVHIATATSHLILAIMTSISVFVHYIDGSYDNPFVLKMIVPLFVGVLPGSLFGAYLSHRVKGVLILKVLSISLAFVGIRILYSSF